MWKTLLEFGHTNERQHTPIFGSCANNPKKNTAQNRVIPYWIDRHCSWHTILPQELSGLKFAEKQPIDVASSHKSLIYLKNGMLGSRGHYVALEQEISKFFLILPRDPKDLNILNVRRSGRYSDQEVYENIFKVRKQNVLADVYWLVDIMFCTKHIK
jgi:hypothetical protein